MDTEPGEMVGRDEVDGQSDDSDPWTGDITGGDGSTHYGYVYSEQSSGSVWEVYQSGEAIYFIDEELARSFAGDDDEVNEYRLFADPPGRQIWRVMLVWNVWVKGESGDRFTIFTNQTTNSSAPVLGVVGNSLIACVLAESKQEAKDLAMPIFARYFDEFGPIEFTVNVVRQERRRISWSGSNAIVELVTVGSSGDRGTAVGGDGESEGQVSEMPDTGGPGIAQLFG